MQEKKESKSVWEKFIEGGEIEERMKNGKSIPISELEKIIAELEELAYTGKEQIGGRKGYFISHCFYADAIDDLKNILKRGYLK